MGAIEKMLSKKYYLKSVVEIPARKLRFHSKLTVIKATVIICYTLISVIVSAKNRFVFCYQIKTTELKITAIKTIGIGNCKAASTNDKQANN